MFSLRAYKNWKGEEIFPYLLIAIGILLRLTDISVPDFSTDEVQATLAASAAWTPLGMQTLRISQVLFEHSMLAARLTSVLFGIGSLSILYLIARHYMEKKSALLAVAIAAIFPSHILFSRLAFLSIQQSFWWLVLLLMFLNARKCNDKRWIYALFFASVAATMAKTQGLLLPGLFLLGLMVEKKKKVLSDEIFWALVFSLIPISFYILTHPGILATVMGASDGGAHGVSQPFSRITDLLSMWWRVLGIFLLVILVSLPKLKTFSWPLWATLLVGTGLGFLLGPGHAYYATHLVLFALPVAIVLGSMKVKMRGTVFALLLAFTLMTLGPRTLFMNPWLNEHYQSVGFWNVYAEELNEALAGEEAVTVLGDAGHHLRWYMEPRVYVGKNLQPPYPTDYVILLGVSEAAKIRGKIELVLEDVALVKQNR
jgi:hypothetical protein